MWKPCWGHQTAAELYVHLEQRYVQFEQSMCGDAERRNKVLIQAGCGAAL